MTSSFGGITPITSRRTPSMSTVSPITGRPPSADCHSSCDRMASGGPLALVSPGENSRPWAGVTPSVVSRSSLTAAPRTRTGRSPAIRFSSPVVNAPTEANDWFSSRNSKNSGGDTQNWSKPMAGKRLVRNISCPGCG